MWIQSRPRSQKRPGLPEGTPQPPASTDHWPLPAVSPTNPCGSEDRVGLRTPPIAGMKETPARPFSPTPGKRQPSLRHQHPWRQEGLGTSVAEALTKQKASWLADQPTSLLSFYSSGRRQRMQNPKVHPPPKGIPRHWEGRQEGLAGMSGRSSSTYPPYPPTNTKRKVYRSPQGSQEDWRLVSPLQVWTASPFTSRHQETAPPRPRWFSEAPNALTQDSGGDRE